MRIMLRKGAQRRLILSAKQGKTWAQLGKMLSLNGDYLRIDLCTEKRLLGSDTYNRLCNIAKLDMSKNIVHTLDENWGKRIGGKKSSGTTKHVVTPKKTKELAELVGIILGDGSLYSNREKGVYALKIAGDKKTEKEYMKFVKSLVDRIFNLNSKLEIRRSEIFVAVYSKEIIERLEEVGLKRGNKKVNNLGIPQWVKKNPEFLKCCVRGLIDTDGSVHKMSNRDPNLVRISFKNRSKNLIQDLRESLISLGFAPSKIIREEQFFISRKENIQKYINEIKFSNAKHMRRIAPWCSGQISLKY